MKRIILIGFMGAGKTTLGKALAKMLSRPFYDLDQYIEGRLHKTIPEIFAERGEAGFREVEKTMLHEVAEFDDVILSCGGGTPCYSDNMDYLNLQGETVFLNASPEVLKEHLLMGGSRRPLIQGKSPDELIPFIRETLSKRLPFYEKAKHTIDIKVIDSQEEIINYARLINEKVAN